MKQNLYASEDGRKLGIFENSQSNHLLFFEYIPEKDVIRVQIRTGENVDASYDINVHNNCLGRKYEEIIGVYHYLVRVLGMAMDAE